MDKLALTLWMILVATVVAVVVVLIITGLPPPPVTVGLDIPPCDKPLDLLPDVSTSQFEPCLTLEGFPDIHRYYDRINNWTVLPLDYEIIPSAQQVCIQFCPQVQLPSLTSTPFSQCITEDETYLACLEKLSPIECANPAVPVARNGSAQYYAIGRGKVSCY